MQAEEAVLRTLWNTEQKKTKLITEIRWSIISTEVFFRNIATTQVNLKQNHLEWYYNR
jgi:hypothetical protein